MRVRGHHTALPLAATHNRSYIVDICIAIQAHKLEEIIMLVYMPLGTATTCGLCC